MFLLCCAGEIFGGEDRRRDLGGVKLVARVRVGVSRDSLQSALARSFLLLLVNTSHPRESHQKKYTVLISALPHHTRHRTEPHQQANLWNFLPTRNVDALLGAAWIHLVLNPACVMILTYISLSLGTIVTFGTTENLSISRVARYIIEGAERMSDHHEQSSS